MQGLYIFIAIITFFAVVWGVANSIRNKKYQEREREYRELEQEVLKELGFKGWNVVPHTDEYVTVKSRQTLQKYDAIRFFKERPGALARAGEVLRKKQEVTKILRAFLKDNPYKERSQYDRLVSQISTLIQSASAYRIGVTYFSSAGNRLGDREIDLFQRDITYLEENPSLLMGKGEYNKYLRDKYQEVLKQKQHAYYERVNAIVDFVNNKKTVLLLKGSAEQIDDLIAQLYDRTVNSIKRVKDIESEEWETIGRFIYGKEEEIREIVRRNEKILAYYKSDSFMKIKETCEALMSTQREFNEYIMEKIDSISHLFGTRVVRNETVHDDEYQYIRPYKKAITPFTAEVSATIFASAENNPLDYVIKKFYPNKELYPEQIQKLRLLIEELETLKEAKQIIDNYKAEYQQYLGDVPDYIMADDEAGFYSRLGFANIDDSVLVVEYKFSYTSGGGKAKRNFTVPMTEETIIGLIEALEGKLSASAFTKEQRALMTSKLRDHIKKRDNYTCCQCGNSIYAEPNLLLEIDHIIPVSKGGCTVEENLQTLCWKCNRAKSNKTAC